MTRQQATQLLGNDKYNVDVQYLGNDSTQIILTPKHINCAMCKTQVKNKEAIKIQDRRVVALQVERKYCPKCANELKEILGNIRGSHKKPIGTMV